MGTFGSDKYTPDQISNALYHAAKAGYRYFDCVAVYGNEDMEDPVIKKLLRDFMFILPMYTSNGRFKEDKSLFPPQLRKISICSISNSNIYFFFLIRIS